MKNRPIRLNNWRYTVAQTVLRLLYGRKWHCISPWQVGGQAAAALMFFEKKLVMGLRAGQIEQAGKWWVVGGYCDLHKQEAPHQTVVREIWEEVGLKISAENFGLDNLFYYTQIFGKTMLELDDECHICLFYTYNLNTEEYAQLTPKEETQELGLFTYAQVLEMTQKGQIAETVLADIAKRAHQQGLLA